MKKVKIQIGIVSPTYNEFENIKDFIENILSLNNYYLINMCFVDDESKDGTVDIIEKNRDKFHKLKVIHRKKMKNTQVYSAYHDGLKWLYKETESLLFGQIDSDNVCDIKTITKSFKFLEKNKNIDLVKLSKYLNNQKDERETIRRFISVIYTGICKFFYNKDISDYSTGIRFYNKKLIKNLISKNKNFTSPIGLLDDLLWIINQDYKVKEIGFHINKRKFGESFFRFKLIVVFGIEFVYCIFKNFKK